MSWIDIPADSHFSLANIPFGVVSHAGVRTPVGATRVGEVVIDLSALERAGLFEKAFGTASSTFFTQVKLPVLSLKSVANSNCPVVCTERVCRSASSGEISSTQNDTTTAQL